MAIIGFNLAPSVWNNFKVAPDTAIVTLVAVLLVAVLFKGLLGRLNILIGVIIGYAYACFRGQVDFSAIGKAAWIGLPEFRLPQVDFTILARCSSSRARARRRKRRPRQVRLPR